jgi:hypothetical protein
MVIRTQVARVTTLLMSMRGTRAWHTPMHQNTPLTAYCLGPEKIEFFCFFLFFPFWGD